MAEKVGRLGLLGLAIEATPGTPASSPTIFVPFTENKIRVHHEPIDDIAARGSRVMQYNSVAGKLWGEGDITMYLDSLNSGYLMKMAFGAETVTQKNASPPVYDHLLTPTVSGNIPVSATLWDNKGVDTQQFPYMTIDTCEITLKNDGLVTIKANLMGKAPSTVSAPAQTTTSGTLYTWANAVVQLGNTVPLALAASATKLTELKIKISNDAELTYKTGSNQPDTVVWKEVKIDGEYTLFFETAAQRDAYANLTKQSMVVTFTGANLGSGYTELLQFVFKKVILKNLDYESGLENLFALKMNFEAEWDQDQAGYVDCIFRNGKSSAYA